MTTCGSDPGVHLVIDNGERQGCTAPDPACPGGETYDLPNGSRLVVFWVVGPPGAHWELHDVP